jgi:hypothetical protein
VEPEDVVHVLSNMIDAVEPGGLVLDLQLIRPDPVVETAGWRVCEIDGTPMFAMVDAATAAVDAAIAAGRLVEEAVDDHDVRKHYVNGTDLIDDFAGKTRKPPEELRLLADPLALRERCRLRALRVIG